MYIHAAGSPIFNTVLLYLLEFCCLFFVAFNFFYGASR